MSASLIAAALEQAEEEFAARPSEEASLEEELFSFIWGGLKRLRGYRNFLAPAMETIFSPLAQFSPERPGDTIRVRHLEAVQQLIAAHGANEPLRAVTLQLYWTLYLGVMAYWAADPSPNQEDSLALLDQSLKLFIASLNKGGDHDQRKSQ